MLGVIFKSIVFKIAFSFLFLLIAFNENISLKYSFYFYN